MPHQDIPYIPHVVVKFLDAPYDAAALEYDVDRYLDRVAWAKLRDKFPNLPAKPERLFTAVTPERLFELVHEAKALALSRHQHYKPTNFFTYFRVPCPEGVNAKAVAKALSEWPGIERAYMAGGPSHPPEVDPINEPLWPQQKHLGPAPLNHTDEKGGIDAHYAWGIPGGDGNGPNLQFIDVEQGWHLGHKDLPVNAAGQPAIQLIYGANRDFFDHGTNVLCTVVGAVNNIDGVGIAPNVPITMAVSIWPNYSTSRITVSDRENAYVAALNRLTAGDVLLLEDQIEIQNGNLPVESEQALFDAIHDLGTARNVIVIEPAGNGGVDLDQFYPGWGDSGAIMVAASTVLDRRAGGGSAPRSQRPDSNFGVNRIDCYAWGEGIITRQEGANTMSFGQTSGASAMIAGAVLALQGIKKGCLGGPPYTPAQLRAMVRDPANGTLSANSTLANPNADKIGVMPDLKKIIGTTMGLAPDVYIRDAVGDDGTTPHTGAIAVSPDIILRLAPGVTNPQAAFGQGSGQENNEWLGINAQAGKDHVIYARVRNRGTADAVNVSATVYSSPVATLLTPNMWTLVGSTVLPLVPKNGNLTVSPPIPWPASQMPASTGHYCFVSFVGNGADPAPEIPASWPSFETFLRDNNNVALRNFFVVTYDPATKSRIPLNFHITGPHDKGRPMRLEFFSKAHKDTEILLQVPFQDSSVIVGMGSPEGDDDFHVTRVRLDPRETIRSREQLFRLNLMADSVLDVSIPKGFDEYPTFLTIRQLYEDREVGRITWRLQPRTA